MGDISSNGLSFDRIYELSELEANTNYKILKYKKVHGSCGVYFYVHAKKHGVEDLFLIRVKDGNLHYYLRNLPSNYKFSIRREVSESGQEYINVNSNSNWISLEDRPSARPFAENDLGVTASTTSS